MDTQMEAAERVELRRWIRQHGARPVVADGVGWEHLRALARQVTELGGDPVVLIDRARAKVLCRRKAVER